MNNNYIGNISTIVKWISMFIAGQVIAVAICYGLELPVDATKLAEIIGGLLWLSIGYIDAKYPNTFQMLGLNNDPEEEA